MRTGLCSGRNVGRHTLPGSPWGDGNRVYYTVRDVAQASAQQRIGCACLGADRQGHIGKHKVFSKIC